MKNYPKFIFLVLFSFILTVSYGCSAEKAQSSNDNESTVVSETYTGIYDGDSKISRGVGTSYYKAYALSPLDNVISGNMDTFYGEDIIWMLNAKNNAKLVLDFDCKISKGKFKIVLIGPDNTVEKISEQPSKGSQTINLKEGLNKVAMVGYNAGGDIAIRIQSMENAELTPK